MVERITGPTPPVRLPHGIGRHPDGDRVPHRPRPAQRGMSRSERIGYALAAMIALVLVALGIAGVQL